MKTNRIYSFLGTLIVLTLFCGNAWGVNWYKVADLSDISNGDSVLIVIQDGKTKTAGKAFIITGTTTANSADVTITNDTSISNPAANIRWAMSESDGVYTFTNGTTYIQAGGTSNSNVNASAITDGNTHIYTWYITKLSKGYFEVQLTNSSGKYLTWKGSCFGKYATSNFIDQISTKATLAANHGAISFYKKGSCKGNPTVGDIMNAVSSISSTGATFSTSTGVSAGTDCDFSAVGFVYGKSSTPTLSNSVATITGYTSGALNKSVTGLDPNTTYHVRAYATNSCGTTYSDEKSFTTLQRYTISYDKNGGSGTIASAYKDHGVSFTLSDGTGFSKTGYTLSGWRLDDASSGTEYDPSDTYTGNANSTFYAQWTINSHTLTWSFGTGGSSSETAGTHYTAGGTKDYGTAITYPSSNSMSRTGYTFSGWSTSVTTMPDNDLTISASWTANEYTITYRDQGDKTFSGTQADAPTTHTYGTATTLKMPTKTGYTFGGWFTASDCESGAVGNTSSASLAGDGYTANITLYAKWTANSYEVAFDKNGGQGDAMSNQSFTYDAAAKALSANTYTPAVGSHTYFAGWATSSERAAAGTVDYADKASVQNLTSTADGTFTLYAVWADHTYTNYRTTCVTRYSITLDKNSGDADGSAKVTENGTTLVKLKAPTKTGYTIEGYYTASSDGDLIADAEGKLEKSVTVSATAWTDEDGKWVKDAGATFYANWTANTYTITLDQNGATTDGTTSVDATYDSNKLSASISNPSKTGYDFGGWYSGVGGTGRMVINSSGTLQNSVTIETIGWTDASGYWILDGTATLYANWTAKTTTVSFDTNSGTGATSDKMATYDAAMPTPITVPTRSGYYFGGYYDGTGTQYYTASGASAKNWDKENGSLTLYARWYGDLKAWCDPAITVTGDVHLTSYEEVPVYATSGAGNLLNFSSSDLGSATSIEIAYLDNSDKATDESPLLLYASDASAEVTEIDVSASRELDADYSIQYKPGDDVFDRLDTYKVQLKLKGGDKVLKTTTHTVYGRALPEEFVIAVKSSADGNWYALPNTMATDNTSHTAPIKITVDNTTTPTSAKYAATTTLYKGQARNTAGSNIQSIRFTTDGTNHLQASTSTGVSNSTLKLPTDNRDGNQAFYLRSSNLAAYTVSIDPSATPTKKLGLYTSSSTMYMGYNESPTDYTIYFLPVTNKYTAREASVYEWGEHGAIVEADMTNVASATMHIDGNDASAATLTAVNGSLGSTKYVKVDGGALTVGAVANDGKLLYIHWKNDGGSEVGVSQITIPYVIAANATMSTLTSDKATWAKREVHILPGKTLTADGESFADNNVTVPTMYVYPGATLDVTTGKLTASTLRLRSGWTRAGTKEYNVARVHIASGKALSKTTFTLDYDIYDSGEGKHYYPIAVPFPVAVSGVDYLDETLATASTYGKHYVIKRYDGASRAENGAIDDNWVQVDDDETLAPSEGYIMTGVGIPAYGGCIIRFLLDANDNWTNNGEKASYNTTTRNVISVSHHTGAATAGGGANVRHEGWNLLANPYLSCFATNGNTTHAGGDGSFITGKMTLTGDPADPYGWDDDEEIYVSVPTHDFSEYIQSNIEDTKLLPGWCFFIQAAKDGNVTFAVTGQQADSDLPIYAPRRAKAEESPIVKTGIVLSSEEASDKTTFLISDRYSDEYEIGADLEKMFGNGYTLATYSLNNGARLAFNAMSTAQANELIPIGVRLPEDGEYTFSLNERYADADIERLDLIDYETGEVTDLMATDYIFYATRSQNDERFALNVQRGKQTPTDIGGADIGAPDGARKILLNGTIFIVRDGLLYDATGKRVQTNK